MKTIKRVLLGVMAALLVISSVGCTSGKKTASQSGEGVKAGYLSDEYIEFDAFLEKSNDEDGQWKIFKEAAKMTNVGINCELSKNHSGFATAFNLMISSGDLPDISWIHDYGKILVHAKQGAFVALNEYFDTCAPNFSKYLDEHPEVRKAITASDGNIYYIPFIPSHRARQAYFVRQDWIDNLGMKTPENTEEFYNMLKAFKEKDPNGNGKADEIPYLGGSDAVNALLTFWEAFPGWYIDGDTVKYGPYEPAYKEALKNIRQWYKDGLIDREVFTRSNATNVLFGNNTGGSCHAHFGSTSGLNDAYKDDIEGFSLDIIAPPSGIELEHNSANPWGWAITTACKDIETAVKYFDFWFSEEGSRLINFGVEGEFYDLIDGKPIFKPEKLADPNFKANHNATGAMLSIGFAQDPAYAEQWMNKIAIDGMQMYQDGGYIKEKFPNVTVIYEDKELEEYQKLNTALTTYVSEYFQKTILGSNGDVDETYDGFIAGLKSLDVEKLIKMQQRAYNLYESR